MKNLAIFCVVLFGCASVAGAVGIPIGGVTVTTAAAADNVQMSFSETLLQNVGTLPGGAEVNEIDLNLVSIGGTYLNGADTIPANTLINTIAGTYYFQGASPACYLYSSKLNGNPVGVAEQENAGGGAIGDIDYPGYWNGGTGQSGMTSFNFAKDASAPNFSATGTGLGNHITAATTITVGEFTSNSLYQIGAFQQNGHAVRGDGLFDNTLLAAFYVSPGTSFVKFYTTDGNPWNVTNSTGGYSQFGFSYGGGRTSYGEIYQTPEPATLALVGSGLLGLLAYAWKCRR